MIKKSSSIKKHPTKLVNQGNPAYPDKPTNHANLIEDKIKETNYEAKFSIISILKDKINKNKFEKKL